MDIYKRIEALCSTRDIDITTMCRDAGISRSIMSEYKAGRTKKLSTDTLTKLAAFFGVAVDYLLGTTDDKKPTSDEAGFSDDDLKLALFKGSEEVTDEMWEEAKFAIELIKERNRRKRENNG